MRHAKKKKKAKKRIYDTAYPKYYYLDIEAGLSTDDKTYDEMVYQGLLDPFVGKFIRDVGLYKRFLSDHTDDFQYGSGAFSIGRVFKDGIGRIHFTIRFPEHWCDGFTLNKSGCWNYSEGVLQSVYELYFAPVIEPSAYTMAFRRGNVEGPYNERDYEASPAGWGGV